MSRVVGSGAERLVPEGAEDGRLAGGGAVLAADGGGTTRVLLVNRGDEPRTALVEIAGRASRPASILVFDDPSGAPRAVAPAAEFVVPARSLCLAELPRGRRRAVRK